MIRNPVCPHCGSETQPVDGAQWCVVCQQERSTLDTTLAAHPEARVAPDQRRVPSDTRRFTTVGGKP
ncbi:hypothetical protein [Galactobacter valiniphilus]|uniref:hypothetical protein n=1 Tax=Galactobacter valiniphilus TaxID=2676122 RepID=UPI003736ED07